MALIHQDRITEAESQHLLKLGVILRKALTERGIGEHFEAVGNSALGYVLDATGDLDLALTSVTMRPRPAWVAEMVGP